MTVIARPTGKAARRVHRAAKFMDKFAPDDWYMRIDRPNLCLSSWDDCVLGQVYGGLDDIPKPICRRITLTGHLSAFGLHWWYNRQFDLKLAWCDEITNRLARAKLETVERAVVKAAE